MASLEVDEAPALGTLLGAELETIKSRVGELFRLVKDANLANHRQDAELSESRQEMQKLREHVGLESAGQRLITRAAAAARLGRTTRTLQRWEKEKGLEPLYPSGNQVYYRREQIQALEDSFSSTPQNPTRLGKFADGPEHRSQTLS